MIGCAMNKIAVAVLKTITVAGVLVAIFTPLHTSIEFIVFLSAVAVGTLCYIIALHFEDGDSGTQSSD